MPADLSPGVYPFRRFFARQFDNLIILFIVYLGVCLWRGTNTARLVEQSYVFLLGVPALLLCSLAEATLLSLNNNTPGKRLFRLYVRPLGENKMSFFGLLMRSTDALIYGQAFYLPLVNLYAGIQAYRDLSERGATRWDAGKFRVEAESFGPGRMLLAGGAFLALLVAWAVVRVFQEF